MNEELKVDKSDIEFRTELAMPEAVIGLISVLFYRGIGSQISQGVIEAILQRITHLHTAEEDG